MTDIDITLRLPEDLVEKARARGVLSSDRIASLLLAEIERIETWQGLTDSFAVARNAFQEDHSHMGEDDVIDMIDCIIHEDDEVTE